MINIVNILLETGVSPRKHGIMEAISHRLVECGFKVQYLPTPEDALDNLRSNTRICAFLFDWDGFGMEIAAEVAQLNESLPLFAFTSKHATMDLTVRDLEVKALTFMEYRQCNEADDVSIIRHKINAYLDGLLPPFTKALFNYAENFKDVFCTPGHLGGAAFLQSPVGTVFYDFYGANTMKSDISISIPELGSLLDHSGPHKDAEIYIARAFGADKSYMVTNGSSTSNKIVGMGCVSAGETVLVDRNCHKSLTHLLMMMDAKPIYLVPTRNALGILGGIPKAEFTQASIEAKMAKHGLTKAPVYTVITNSTYDGLFYNAGYVKSVIKSPYLHFDSAWAPYTQFHPIYKDLSGLTTAPVEGKTVFETQSTHKLLAAFSQASMIHIQGEMDEADFNEAFMMHSSTSPQYSIVASCEISAAMMQGAPGHRIIEHSLNEAMNFRREMVRLAKELSGWFYGVWQPESIEETACWNLGPNDTWHGFKGIDPNHIFLDPIKVTLTLPGVKGDAMEDMGIPAALVAKYLDEDDIIVEKTGPYTLLFLFSIGITKEKSMKLLKGLMDFKDAYDRNDSIKESIPGLFAIDPDFYSNMTLQKVAMGIHQKQKEANLPTLMYKAFDTLPEQYMTPYEARQIVIKGQTKRIALSELKGRVSANMILPYPPGIPIVMPGERITDESLVILEYLEMLCEIGELYPGFETDIHGVYPMPSGGYGVKVIEEL